MAADDVVTWSRTRSESGCVSGLLLGVFGGMLIGSAAAAFVPESWAAVSLVPTVVLAGYGAVRGAALRRAEVTTAEFTRTRVQLVSSLGERVVDVAELTVVDVGHHGNPEAGYQETVLRLEFADGPAESIPGRYDPELAPILRWTLGPGVDVRERHQKFVPPPTA